MANISRPSFAHWLVTNGKVTAADLGTLNKEWNKTKANVMTYKTYTTAPVTWGQFIASKYPREVLAYQAFLRLTGAAPTFRKD